MRGEAGGPGRATQGDRHAVFRGHGDPRA